MPSRSTTLASHSTCVPSLLPTRQTGSQTSRNTLTGWWWCSQVRPSPVPRLFSPYGNWTHARTYRHVNLLSSCSGEKVTRAVWVPDAMSKECMICGQRFSAFVRKHHCRQCGQVVCSSCSPHRVDMRPADGSREAKAERICKKCFKQPKAVLRGTVALRTTQHGVAIARHCVHTIQHQVATDLTPCNQTLSTCSYMQALLHPARH